MEGPTRPTPRRVDATASWMDRRDFLRLAGASLGGVAAGIAAPVIWNLIRPPVNPNALAPFETSPGVVDYSRVPTGLSGPTPNLLKVAQWYDYWPGSFINDFVNYMQLTYNLAINVRVDIYTSNEQLYQLLALGRQTYDVVFPSNELMDRLKLGGVFNLNLDWIPNFANLWSDFLRVPSRSDSGSNVDQRADGATVDFVGLPYFWGTTGVGYRSDLLPRSDVVANGMDFLWMSSFQPSMAGYTTVDLVRRMTMLDDERDVLGWGFKKAGWEDQKARGLVPSGLVPPGGAQWSVNDTDSGHIASMDAYLTAAIPNLFGFNSSAGASLVSGSQILTQAWSGDVMYAKRPDQNVALPIDFIIPHQGSPWWIDYMAIPRTSRNLWLAHRFINFIHNVSNPWPENQLLTRWNLYSTPNKACYDLLGPFPNGWNMATDPVLYPNLYDTQGWAVCEMARFPGSDVQTAVYDPVWLGLNPG